jgi:hypothetical protein
MSKALGFLATSALLWSIGSMSVSALPTNGARVSSPPAADLVQYEGGRCFNRCVSGRMFRRCQNDSEARRESCCNLACNRFNNRFYW